LRPLPLEVSVGAFGGLRAALIVPSGVEEVAMLATGDEEEPDPMDVGIGAGAKTCASPFDSEDCGIVPEGREACETGEADGLCC
jgi:hypothetical protein